MDKIPEYIVLKASDQSTSHKVKDLLEFEIESYVILGRICENYLDDYEFFINFLPEIRKGNHEIISVYLDGKNIATAFLEKPNLIHRFFVTPKHRAKIALMLIKECCKWLDTTQPKVSLLEDQLPYLSAIINDYNWVESQIIELNNGTKHLFNQ